MRISELAKLSSFSVDTIRFYEKKGLLDSQQIRRDRNNYRDYSPECLQRLMLIRQAKRLGFTLREIQQWIRDFESDTLTPKEKRYILSQKIEQIDRRIEDLMAMKNYLTAKINAIDN